MKASNSKPAQKRVNKRGANNTPINKSKRTTINRRGTTTTNRNGYNLGLSVNGVGHATLSSSQSLPTLNAPTPQPNGKTKTTRKQQTFTAKRRPQQSAQPQQNSIRSDSLPDVPAPSRQSAAQADAANAKKIGFLTTVKTSHDADKKQLPAKKKKKLTIKDALTKCKYAWDDENRMDVMRSQIAIRYSHYNKTFEARNGIIRWSDINDEYCIGFVFKGDFKRHVVDERNPDFLAYEVAHEDTSKKSYNNNLAKNTKQSNGPADYFMGLESINDNYVLKIEEDEKAGIIGKIAYHAPPRRSTTTGQQLLTQELKSKSANELRERTGDVKDLLEAREREAILFNA